MSRTGHVPWWTTAVIYQVYVRSFADADDDGIGDLDGLRSRLPYIAALGADAIWLNPCYPSPQRDHGYDVSDYFDIDPAYGDLAAFDALVDQARAYGIRVLMDVVPNHCSDEHEWFVEAVAAGPGSPARERFWFRDGRGPDGQQPPNDWTAIFGGSAWTRVTEPDGTPGQWYLGVFTPHQPDFNWHHPDVAAHFDRMLRFWFDRGVEGFRADAVTVLGKAEGLPDVGEPVAFGHANHLFSYHDDGHTAWRRWRRVVDEYNASHGREVMLIAEAWTPNRPDILQQYISDEEFHQGFAFDLTMAPWRADAWRTAIDQTLSLTAPRGLHAAWTLNNHDVERSVTRYGRADATQPRDPALNNLVTTGSAVDEQLGRRRARAAATAMMALPGSLYLYAGEELGLPEVLDLPDDARQDPIFVQTAGRHPGRDGCRVPLPWTASARAAHGFSASASAAPPWLPQPDGWGRHSAETLEADPASTLHLYRNGTAIRRKLTGLRDGEMAWLDVAPDVVAFQRGDVVVVLNMGSAPVRLGEALTSRRRTVLSSSPTPPAEPGPSEVPGDTCIWLAP